jgi:glycosyltransferase involved in cell wall biosynthesis
MGDVGPIAHRQWRETDATKVRQEGKRRPMAFVSVVTPVYNGEAFLAQCIESVLAQSFADWEYVIVDNCSSDRSRSLAETYARKDPRIRVYHNDRVLPVIASFNRAASLASRESRYLKFLCADDLLMPDCLIRMVEVAEANPAVQLVAAYKIHGQRAVCEGPAFPLTFMAGREVCRRFFQGTFGFLGSPTDHLIRLPTISLNDTLFDESYLHADIEFSVRLLKEGTGYGFVHQILTFTRVHKDAVSGFAHVMGTGALEFLTMVLKHGPAFLSGAEHAELVKLYRDQYARFLFRVLLKVWDRRIWRYQVDSWRKFGIEMGLLEVLGAGLRETAVSALSPRETLRRLRREYARADHLMQTKRAVAVPPAGQSK